ncbi:hypothetical protein [uncultured Alistipes sp.]|uniref:hypothetical protein n=1 Tax=uncultured Alistipes sp. TaxID=538949 RepID=UPI00260C9428|nr:hypothetical protein [uncultured Alistipes sp.]
MKDTAVFRAEATCGHPACEQMNLHLNIIAFDDRGERSSSDYADAEPMRRDRTYAVKTNDGATEAAVSLYVVPTDDPVSDRVADTPDFDLTLRIFKGDETIETKTIKINGWGGNQLIGLRYR